LVAKLLDSKWKYQLSIIPCSGRYAVPAFVTDRGLPNRLRKIAQDCNVTIIEAMDKVPHAAEDPSRDYPQAAS